MAELGKGKIRLGDYRMSRNRKVDYDLIRAMAEQGIRAKVIAAEAHCSTNTVYYAVRKMGIPFEVRNEWPEEGRRWASYTEEEICNDKKKNCVRCRYRGYTGNITRGSHALKNLICDYLAITGHARGCSPINCEKFEKGGYGRDRKGIPVTGKDHPEKT